MCGIAGIISNQFSEEERHLFVSRMMQHIEIDTVFGRNGK